MIPGAACLIHGWQSSDSNARCPRCQVRPLVQSMHRAQDDAAEMAEEVMRLQGEHQELLMLVVQIADQGCLCQDPESTQEPCMERGEWPAERCCVSCRARKWLKEHDVAVY